MLSTLLMLLVIGIVGVVALTVVMGVIGAVFGVLGFLLFKVAPVLLIGWVVMKLVKRARTRSRIESADQRWLDG